MGALLITETVAGEGPGGWGILAVPDGETATVRESPKTTLGNVMLQDKELVAPTVSARDESLPFTDQAALTFKEKAATDAVDRAGTNAGF